jgi:hypothetical protein
VKGSEYTREEMEALQAEFLKSRCTICGSSLPEGAWGSCPKCDARWAYNINKRAGETEADREATEVVRTTGAKNGPNWGVIALVVVAAGVLLGVLVSMSNTNSGGVSTTSSRYSNEIQREAAKADAWMEFERAHPEEARKLLDSLRSP